MRGLAATAARRGLTTPEAAAKDPTEAYTRAWFTPGIYDRSPGWARGLERGTMDLVNDPLTAIGASGAGEAVARGVAEHALPLAVKTGDALAGLGDAGKAVAKTATTLHNLTTTGGPEAAALQRELTRDYGKNWLEQYAKAWGARKFTAAQTSQIINAFGSERDSIFKGLTDPEKTLALRAVDRGTVNPALAQRFPKAYQAAQSFQNLTKSIAYLGGSKQLRKKLAGEGFALPDFAKPFDVPAGTLPRGLQKTTQYREKYVPRLHEFTSPEAGVPRDPRIQAMIDARANRRMAKIDLSKTASGFLKPRRAHAPDITVESLPETQAAIQARIESAARTLSGQDLRRRVAGDFASKARLKSYAGDVKPQDIAKAAKDAGLSEADFAKLSPSIRSLFTRKYQPLRVSTTPQPGLFADVPNYVKSYLKPSVKGPAEQLEENLPLLKTARGATNLGKSGLFYQPTPHMRNIGTMTALRDPGAVVPGLVNWARMGAGFGGNARKYEQMKDVIRAGSVGMENAEDVAGRGALHGAVDKTASVLEKGGKPGQIAGAAVRGAAKPVEALYKASGKALWSFDDAMTAALTRRNIAKGLSPTRAAYEARNALVDYGEQSEAGKLLRSVFPFASWRTKMPAAVLSSFVRHPENAMTMMRANPKLGGAVQGDPSSSTGFSTSTTPISETFTALNDPVSFLRGSLTTTGREAMNPLTNRAATGRYGKDWWTYGIPGPQYYGAQLPYVSAAEDVAGHGLFPKKPGQAIKEGLTGVRETKPTKPHPGNLDAIAAAIAKRLPQPSAAAAPAPQPPSAPSGGGIDWSK